MTQSWLKSNTLSHRFDGNKIIKIMKTYVTLTLKKEDLIKSKAIEHLLFGIILIATLGFNSLNAQSQKTAITEINVNGMVSDEAGPLAGVNIALNRQ